MKITFWMENTSVNKEYQLDVTLPNIAMWTYKAMYIDKTTPMIYTIQIEGNSNVIHYMNRQHTTC